MDDFPLINQDLERREAALNAYLLDPASKTAETLRGVVVSHTVAYLNSTFGAALSETPEPESLGAERRQLDVLSSLAEGDESLADALEEAKSEYEVAREAAIAEQLGAIVLDTEQQLDLDVPEDNADVEGDDIYLTGNGKDIVDYYLNGLRSLSQDDTEDADPEKPGQEPDQAATEGDAPAPDSPELEPHDENTFQILSATIEVDKNDPRVITVNGEQAAERIAGTQVAADVRLRLLRAFATLFNATTPGEEADIKPRDVWEASGVEDEYSSSVMSGLRPWMAQHLKQANGDPVIRYHEARRASYYWTDDQVRPDTEGISSGTSTGDSKQDGKEGADGSPELEIQTEFHVVVGGDGTLVSISDIDMSILTPNEREYLEVLIAQANEDPEVEMHAGTIANKAAQQRTGMSGDHGISERAYNETIESLLDKLRNHGLQGHIAMSSKRSRHRAYRAIVDSYTRPTDKLIDIDSGLRVALGVLAIIESLQDTTPRADGHPGVKKRGLGKKVADELGAIGITMTAQDAATIVDKMIADGSAYKIAAKGSDYVSSTEPANGAGRRRNGGGKNQEQDPLELRVDFDPTDDLKAILGKYNPSDGRRSFTERNLVTVEGQRSTERVRLVEILKRKGILAVVPPSGRRRQAQFKLSDDAIEKLSDRSTRQETINHYIRDISPPE